MQSTIRNPVRPHIIRDGAGRGGYIDNPKNTFIIWNAVWEDRSNTCVARCFCVGQGIINGTFDLLGTASPVHGHLIPALAYLYVETYRAIDIDTVIIDPVFEVELPIRQVAYCGSGQPFSVVDHLFHIRIDILTAETFDEV